MRGFTLIETLLYLALFSILIGGFVISAYGLFETNDRNLAKALMQEEKDFVIGKINWALNGAQSVTVPASGASSNTLTLTKYGGALVTLTASGAGVTQNGNPLTNSNVTISKLVFIHKYTGGANPESVEAGFTISTVTAEGATISQTASTTRYIRK